MSKIEEARKKAAEKAAKLEQEKALKEANVGEPDTLTAEEEQALDELDAQQGDPGDEQPNEEDPVIVAQREEKFRRAQEFEANRAAARGQKSLTANLDNENTRATTDVLESARPAPVDMVAAKAAADKLHRMAADISPSTPGEHTLFGRAGIRFTVSDLRALTGHRA